MAGSEREIPGAGGLIPAQARDLSRDPPPPATASVYRLRQMRGSESPLGGTWGGGGPDPCASSGTAQARSGVRPPSYPLEISPGVLAKPGCRLPPRDGARLRPRQMRGESLRTLAVSGMWCARTREGPIPPRRRTSTTAPYAGAGITHPAHSRARAPCLAPRGLAQG